MQEQTNYNVSIYARLSRDDERSGESVSIENQKELLTLYVKEQGWTLYSTYCDDGVSGTTFIPEAFPLPVPEVAVNTRKGVVVNYAPCQIAI